MGRGSEQVRKGESVKLHILSDKGNSNTEGTEDTERNLMSERVSEEARKRVKRGALIHCPIFNIVHCYIAILLYCYIAILLYCYIAILLNC